MQLGSAQLVAISHLPQNVPDATHLEAWVKVACARGAQALILRENHRSLPEQQRLWGQLQHICHRLGLPVSLAVNTAVPALFDGLQQVHLKRTAPQPVGQVLRWGRSCHTTEALTAARDAGAAWAFFSPVKPTASHPGQDAMGWAAFAEGCRAAYPLPVYALGGVSPADVPIARANGAVGIAAISAFSP